MTKLELYQELVSIISPTTIVKYGKGFYYEPKTDTISLEKHFEYDLQRNLRVYILLDHFNYLPYCSSYLFVLLHELGHLINGVTPYYTLMVKSIENSDLSPYEKVYEYFRLDDEYYAYHWALDFAKKNKNVLKRLERELVR